MSGTRVFRFVDYSIGLDPNTSRDMEEMECTSCGDPSGCDSFDNIVKWAINHTARTGHSGFRQITTNYHRVVRHDQDLASQLSPPVGPTHGQVDLPEGAQHPGVD
jgi:hypothetical protein